MLKVRLLNTDQRIADLCPLTPAEATLQDASYSGVSWPIQLVERTKCNEICVHKATA